MQILRSLLPTKVLPSLLAALVFATPIYSADKDSNSELKIKPGPPPGFEELANPQTTAVDLYYGGKHIGSALATYTPGIVELESPGTVVALIPRISNLIEVESALSGPLSANSEKVCLTELQRDCGPLVPAVAEVIFDEGYFRLDVFVNAFYLDKKELVSTKFLPESVTEFSTVNLFSSSASGNDNNNTYAFGSRHIAAHKQSRLQLEWNHTDTRNMSVENLSLQHDKGVWTTEAGLFDSSTRNSSFVSDAELLGARIYSSTNTRTDLDYSQSTEIFQFLTSPSVIEIFKDDVLVSVDEYEAGNQQVETLPLPGGSYPIRLRITDARGEIREEEYFFVKSGLLPPKDQPLYFLELGRIGESIQNDTFPEYTNDHLARAGGSFRLHDKFGVNFELLHGAKVSIAQGGAVYLGPNYNIQGNLMQSSEDDWGVDLQGQMNREGINLSFNYRQVESDREDDRFNDDFKLVPNSFTQGSIAASTLFFNGTLSLRSRYNKRVNQDSISSYGFEYRKPLYRKNRYQIDFTSSSFIEDDDLSMWFGLSFNRFIENKQYSSNLRYVSQEIDGSTEQDVEFNGEVTYSGNTPNFGTYNLGLFANDTIDQSAIGTRVRSQSLFGRGDFLLEHVDDKSSGSYERYFGNASFSIFSSGHEVAWGGNRNSKAGLIVELESESSESPFEVFVDRQPHGYAKSGKSTVIGLTPYENYEVQIKPRGDEIVHFEDSIRNITLYPGNVEKLHWKISQVTVLISNAVFDDGTAVANAKFENTTSFASTDADGWFQVEIANREPLILSKGGKTLCKIILPEFESEQGVAILNQVICRPFAESPTQG